MADDNVNAFEKFQVDKMHETLVKCGEEVDRSLSISLMLLLVTGILAFGEGAIADKVKVPLLDLELDKTYTTVISLLLSCAVLYKFFTTLTGHEVMANKLWSMVKDAYSGKELQSTLRIEYPSVIWATVALSRELTKKSPKAWRFMYWLFFGFVLSLIGFGLPIVFCAKIISDGETPIGWILVPILGVFLIPAVIAHVHFLNYQVRKQKDFDRRQKSENENKEKAA